MLISLLATQVRKGKVIPADSVIDPAWIKKNYAQSWQDMATMTDDAGKAIVAGIWARFNGKSIVWYPKKAFDEAGYTVPATWDELMALSDQIASDGDTPWCIGIESGAATGWPMTDATGRARPTQRLTAPNQVLRQRIRR